MTTQSLRRAAPADLRAWTADVLLPFWADTGFDGAAGLWAEQVTLDGRADDPGFRRLRVQARQTYVFALAEATGLFPAGRGLARAGRAAMDRMRTAEGGYLTRVDSSGAPLDTQVLLYDQAFVLLALSACHRAGDATAEAEAVRLRAFLDAAMAHPDGGYLGTLGEDPGTAPREQDPHMHLFEACLSWADATADAGADDCWLAHADALAGLIRERFLDDCPHLYERVSPDGTLPDPAAESGALDGQPGHFCEWVWLIDWYARLGGRHAKALSAVEDGLYRRAMDGGLDRDPARPFALVNAFTPDGLVSDPGKRFWPQTEAIKAANLMARRGELAARDLADRLWDSVFAHYLEPHNGVMRDKLSADGRRCAPFAPASSLYHLFVALLDTLDLFHGAAPAALPVR